MILVVIPTYNERENIERLVRAVLAVDRSLHVLVIDDNSPDGTGELADRLAAAEPRVRVLHRPGKLGLGTATVAGLREGLRCGASGVLVMDADFSHHPRYIPALLAAARDGADVAVGSRYVHGGGVRNWPWHRRWMSRLINTYGRLWLGLTVRDISGAYRLYATRALRRIDLAQIWSKGYSFQEEILFRLRRAGAVFREVPIVFEDRRLGQSKINLREAIVAVIIITLLGLGAATGLLPPGSLTSGQAHAQGGNAV